MQRVSEIKAETEEDKASNLTPKQRSINQLGLHTISTLDENDYVINIIIIFFHMIKPVTEYQTIEYLWMKNPECALQVYGRILPLYPTTNIVVGIYFDNDNRECCQVYVDVNSEEDFVTQEDNKHLTEYVYTKAGLFVAEWQHFHMYRVTWMLN